MLLILLGYWLFLLLKGLVRWKVSPLLPFISEDINCIYEEDPRGSRS